MKVGRAVTPGKSTKAVLETGQAVEVKVPSLIPSRFVDRTSLIDGRLTDQLLDRRLGLRVGASAQDGAELGSFAVREAEGWHELLYRGNYWQPTSDWPGRGPWLWPVAGRCYGGPSDQPGVYRTPQGFGELPPHGFIRHRKWNRSASHTDANRASCEMVYKSQRHDHQAYPFHYTLTCRYELSAEGLRIIFVCAASKQNIAAMPFHLGMHFTFDFASWWGDAWREGSMCGLGGSAWRADDRKLATVPTETPDVGRIADPAISDLIIPARGSAPARLVSPDGERELSMTFDAEGQWQDDPRFWVTHGDPQGRYFCLEPWVGKPNAINTGEGLVKLEPGGQWRFNINVAIRRGRESGD